MTVVLGVLSYPLWLLLGVHFRSTLGYEFSATFIQELLCPGSRILMDFTYTLFLTKDKLYILCTRCSNSPICAVSFRCKYTIGNCNKDSVGIHTEGFAGKKERFNLKSDRNSVVWGWARLGFKATVDRFGARFTA